MISARQFHWHEKLWRRKKKLLTNRYQNGIIIKMSKSTIQIPINNDLRIKAGKRAKELGYSSLQEIIRIFITELAKNHISVKIFIKNKGS